MNLLREEAQENVIKDVLKEYDQQILKQYFIYGLWPSLEVSKMTILGFQFYCIKMCIYFKI
jgi:hypothetical protein